MNRSHRILPVYTGDVSGACSALFELGGMVVIHDPSGCNSTYNTHDETRWYDHDSLIFISALTEKDAILGNDDKLLHNVMDAARELKPRFVALCNSPVPFLSGTDFPALCRLLERELHIPCFYVRTNGMHDYTVGAGSAFDALAHRFVMPAHVQPNTLNILGLTPLDGGTHDVVRDLHAFAHEAGFEVVSCWAMDSSLDHIARAGSAAVNLVVSSTGFAAAKTLQQRFGTPYVVGWPVGASRDVLAQALRDAAASGMSATTCRNARTAATDGSVCLVGEPVTMGSLAVAAQHELGTPVRVVCPTETYDGLLLASDVASNGEEEVEEALAAAQLIVGDPFFSWVAPEDARFVSLPHQAFSGRNGWKGRRDLTRLDVSALLSR